MSKLCLSLKPGDTIVVDRYTVLTCKRARAGQLGLEIEAPLDVLIQHKKADPVHRATLEIDPAWP